MADNHAHHYNPRQVTTIEVLPDDVLLEIFDVRDEGLISGPTVSFEVEENWAEWWQPLVHVCRRWRNLILASPHRLNLQLYCTLGTVTRKNLDVWPPLPLLIRNDDDYHMLVDDLTSVFEHSNRIRQINLGCDTLSQFEKVWAAMQVPFPELTALILGKKPSRGQSPSETVTVLPDSLGGSVPRLRYITFIHIPFLGLPKLLLSATHLVNLRLYDVPHSGYISPEEMVTCLSVLTSLEDLWLGFESPQSCPDQESGRYTPPPPTRPVLTLMNFLFKGVNEYLEDFLARIDAPRLNSLWIRFFNDIFFDTPQLIQFIGRTLTFNPPNKAEMAFYYTDARFRLESQSSNFEVVNITILCREPDWQLSALAQICTSFLPLLSATDTLYIKEHSSSKPDWKDGIENSEWLELLFPFTAVKNLYLTEGFEPCIPPALQELTGSLMTEVLPTLQNIFLEGFRPSEPVQEGIGQLITGRQLTDHPITISSWDRYPEQEDDDS